MSSQTSTADAHPPECEANGDQVVVVGGVIGRHLHAAQASAITCCQAAPVPLTTDVCCSCPSQAGCSRKCSSGPDFLDSGAGSMLIFANCLPLHRTASPAGKTRAADRVETDRNPLCGTQAAKTTHASSNAACSAWQHQYSQPQQMRSSRLKLPNSHLVRCLQLLRLIIYIPT
jgi:hypothetical protein